MADVNGANDGSTTYPGLPAANLNDGDRDGDYANGGGVDGSGSIAHTAGTGNPQEMGVTLMTPTYFATVDIFNRTDCCSDRIDNGGNNPFTLNVYNGAMLVFTNDYKFTPTISLSAANVNSPNMNGIDTASGMVIPVGKLGTYVQVVQHNPSGDSYMNLAELEAYTPEPASLTLFGLGALGLLAHRR